LQLGLMVNQRWFIEGPWFSQGTQVPQIIKFICEFLKVRCFIQGIQVPQIIHFLWFIEGPLFSQDTQGSPVSSKQNERWAAQLSAEPLVKFVLLLFGLMVNQRYQQYSSSNYYCHIFVLTFSIENMVHFVLIRPLLDRDF
jgi:hypothetical protein